MRYAVRTGTVMGTGARIDVPLGFEPDYIKLFNISDADGLAPTMEWAAGMPAQRGFKTLRVVDNGTTGRASSTYVTTNGISLYPGDDNTPQGFSIGADTDINVNGETIVWVAMRSM